MLLKGKQILESSKEHLLQWSGEDRERKYGHFICVEHDTMFFFFLCKDVWWYVEWVEEGDSATSRCSQLQPHH